MPTWRRFQLARSTAKRDGSMIGASSSAATGDGPGALEGIRVLDVGVLVQGPQAGQMLNDLGADVVKVELPGVGDYSRWLPVSAEDRRAPWFVACNRGKRSIALDLRTPDGAKLFLDLAGRSDVVISNFVPGTMERWGLGYEALSARNAGIVYALASAFGFEGKTAVTPGLDLGGQARSGLISINGPSESGTGPVGATIGDHIGAQNLTIAILAALFARARTGRGQQVATSLLGGLLFAQASEMTAYFLSGNLVPVAGRGHGMIRSLYGMFKTSDGAIVITHVPETSRAAFWSAVGFANVARSVELSGPLTPETKEEVFQLLDLALARDTTESWCRVFDSLDVAHAPVRTYRDVDRDPDAFLNGYLQKVDHPRWGTITMPGNPVRMSMTPVRPGKVAPSIGEHSEEVLEEYLGLEKVEIARLRADGTI